MHTGGDLSTPRSVRSIIQPNPLPAYDPAPDADGSPSTAGTG